MALVTKRSSRDITFSIASCSLLSKRPASVPAPTVARISSLVIVVSFFVGNPMSLRMPLLISVNSQTNGLKSQIKNIIEPMSIKAKETGLFKPIRLGIKSANSTKTIVIVKKEQKNPKEEASSGEQK